VEGAADKPGPGKCNWQALWADKSARQDERDFIRLSGCIAVLMKFLPERQRHKSAKNVNLKIYIICESQQKLQVGKDSYLYICVYIRSTVETPLILCAQVAGVFFNMMKMHSQWLVFIACLLFSDLFLLLNILSHWNFFWLLLTFFNHKK